MTTFSITYADGQRTTFTPTLTCPSQDAEIDSAFYSILRTWPTLLERLVLEAAPPGTVGAIIAVSTLGIDRITDLYEGLLGRAPTTAEIVAGQRSFAATEDSGSLYNQLATSDAADAAIEQAFVDETGTPPTQAEAADTKIAADRGSNEDLRAYIAAIYAPAAIQAYYEGLVGRPPSWSETLATQRLLAEGESLATLRHGAVSSPEVAQAVGAIWQSVLGRAAEPAAVSAAVSAIANGSTLSDMRAAVARSPEAAMRVGDIYEQVLGRAAEPSAVAANQAAMAAGASLGQMRSAVAHSAEATADVQGIYQEILGRAAETSAVVSAETALTNGATLSSIRAGVAGSAEAMANVQAIYQQVLGRAAEGSAVINAETVLANDGTLAGLRAAVAGSAEAAAQIGAIYQHDLGRPAEASAVASARDYLAHGGTLAGLNSAAAGSAEGQAYAARWATLMPAPSYSTSALAPGHAPTLIVAGAGAQTSAWIVNFDPAQDTLRLPAADAANVKVAALPSGSGVSGTAISFAPTSGIVLLGVQTSQLQPADFRFG